VQECRAFIRRRRQILAEIWLELLFDGKLGCATPVRRLTRCQRVDSEIA
jgi:hypothetical protein